MGILLAGRCWQQVLVLVLGGLMGCRGGRGFLHVVGPDPVLKQGSDVQCGCVNVWHSAFHCTGKCCEPMP